MSIPITYSVVCPKYNKETSLTIYYNKRKSSPNDVGYDFNYGGFRCSILEGSKLCPLVKRPLIQKLGLQRYPYR